MHFSSDQLLHHIVSNGNSRARERGFDVLENGPEEVHVRILHGLRTAKNIIGLKRETIASGFINQHTTGLLFLFLSLGNDRFHVLHDELEMLGGLCNSERAITMIPANVDEDTVRLIDFFP